MFQAHESLLLLLKSTLILPFKSQVLHAKSLFSPGKKFTCLLAKLCSRVKSSLAKFPKSKMVSPVKVPP